MVKIGEPIAACSPHIAHRFSLSRSSSLLPSCLLNRRSAFRPISRPRSYRDRCFLAADRSDRPTKMHGIVADVAAAEGSWLVCLGLRGAGSDSGVPRITCLSTQVSSWRGRRRSPPEHLQKCTVQRKPRYCAQSVLQRACPSSCSRTVCPA